jgi:hypothetical protein
MVFNSGGAFVGREPRRLSAPDAMLGRFLYLRTQSVRFGPRIEIIIQHSAD